MNNVFACLHGHKGYRSWIERRQIAPSDWDRCSAWLNQHVGRMPSDGTHFPATLVLAISAQTLPWKGMFQKKVVGNGMSQNRSTTQHQPTSISRRRLSGPRVVKPCLILLCLWLANYDCLCCLGLLRLGKGSEIHWGKNKALESREWWQKMFKCWLSRDLRRLQTVLAEVRGRQFKMHEHR